MGIRTFSEVESRNQAYSLDEIVLLLVNVASMSWSLAAFGKMAKDKGKLSDLIRSFEKVCLSLDATFKAMGNSVSKAVFGSISICQSSASKLNFHFLKNY